MRFRRPRLHDYHLYVVILWGVSFEYGVTPRVTSGVPQISLRAPQSAAAARRRRSLGRQDQDSSQSRPSAEKNIFSFCGHFCRHFSGGFLEAFFARTKKNAFGFDKKSFKIFSSFLRTGEGTRFWPFLDIFWLDRVSRNCSKSTIVWNKTLK